MRRRDIVENIAVTMSVRVTPEQYIDEPHALYAMFDHPIISVAAKRSWSGRGLAVMCQLTRWTP